MRGRLLTAVVVAAFFLGGLSPAVTAGEEDSRPDAPAEAPEGFGGRDYVIGPGDILEIGVWKEEALTKVVPVLPDGTVTFPLVGEIMAGGKTVAELQEELVGRISRYMPEPVLTVTVQQVNSMLVYVIGRVQNPGRFALNTTVNVMQALAMAGGLTPFAQRGEIRVFRESGGRTRLFPFDYDAVAQGADLERNIRLERGDVIVVP